MDDGSLLYIFYGGKMIMDDKAMKLMDEGKPWKPKSGIDYWINAPLIRTSSQKYDYMNYIQLIGKGVIADLSDRVWAFIIFIKYFILNRERKSNLVMNFCSSRKLD